MHGTLAGFTNAYTPPRPSIWLGVALRLPIGNHRTPEQWEVEHVVNGAGV